ncbi:MAG: hypothetical protein VCB63_05095 [Alphaproteobacteria bacterium]
MSEMSQSTKENEALIDAISDLLSPLLNSMETLNHVARNLHPPNLGNLVTSVENVDAALRQGLKHFHNQKWPEHLSCFADQMITAAEAVCSGFDSLRDAGCAPDGIFLAHRGIRQNAKAFAAIYPAASTLPPINRFFLNDAGRVDEALVENWLTLMPVGRTWALYTLITKRAAGVAFRCTCQNIMMKPRLIP